MERGETAAHELHQAIAKVRKLVDDHRERLTGGGASTSGDASDAVLVEGNGTDSATSG